MRPLWLPPLRLSSRGVSGVLTRGGSALSRGRCDHVRALRKAVGWEELPEAHWVRVGASPLWEASGWS